MGFRITMDIAKGALATAGRGMSVNGHNIANVDTPGYSRQTETITTNRPYTIGSTQLGTGATLEHVNRHADQRLEERLADQKSKFATYDEAIVYIDNLEALFNVDSDTHLGSLMSNFWQGWHEVANHPDDPSARSVLLESATNLSGQFNTLSNDINRLKTNVGQDIDAGVERVNTIMGKIAKLNTEIFITESTRPANDQRDMRGQLVTELSEFLNVNTVEQPTGYLSIMTSNGYPLVVGNRSYDLTSNRGSVGWETSAGGIVDVSRAITHGKLGGWLMVKDDILSEVDQNLDSLAKEVIWRVNKVHSQGVGTSYHQTAVTSSEAPAGGNLYNLAYGDRIDYDGGMKVWAKKLNSPNPATAVEVDTGISTTSPVKFTGTGMPMSRYRITVEEGGTVGPGADDPVLRWERLGADNTPVALGRFAITGENKFSSTPPVEGIGFDIGKGRLVAGNVFEFNTSEAGIANPVELRGIPEGRARCAGDRYTLTVVEGGGSIENVSPKNPMILEWQNSTGMGTIRIEEPEEAQFDVDGMTLSIDKGTLMNGDSFVVKTGDAGQPLDLEGNTTAEQKSSWHWTTFSLADQFNRQASEAGVDLRAFISNTGNFELRPDFGVAFAFSDSTARDGGVAAALGLNTFFKGQDAATIDIAELVKDPSNIAAARVRGAGSDAITSNLHVTNPEVRPVEISTAGGPAVLYFEEDDVPKAITVDPRILTSRGDLHTLAHDMEQAMNAASNLSNPYKVRYVENENRFEFSENDGSPLQQLTLRWDRSPALAELTGFRPEPETFVPAAGDYGKINNENALLMADMQHVENTMPHYAYTRDRGAVAESLTTTPDGFYRDMLGSIGVRASSFRKEKEMGGMMVEKLSDIRESISGVSVDEELVRMLAHQQAYQAASKLITTSDEMLQTLLNMR
ncbi:flagellar hook-associated protein FlgK [Desulfoluna spongiiphila]|uniref:Flagellar hook-associated protein 1 n=1 Tax=Desulfoluna spongiiphila TaxID=419481 RepID=A0A1G5J4T9_9BACT|nr:flagellar hook-associated protein FlgK [Desulfoluna spongiiphila]SCY82708.1 flagellar hook-associated protein FlgK [Desulfoluna spongiiphila]